MTDKTKFYLSFSDGICRLSHGNDIESATEDMERTLIATNRFHGSILDSEYSVVKEVYQPITGG